MVAVGPPLTTTPMPVVPSPRGRVSVTTARSSAPVVPLSWRTTPAWWLRVTSTSVAVTCAFSSPKSP